MPLRYPFYTCRKGKNTGRMAGRNDIRIKCSFCGRTEDQVRKLIAGPDGAYICDECIQICAEILDEEFHDAPLQDASGEFNLMKPREIRQFLDAIQLGKDTLLTLERGKYIQSLIQTAQDSADIGEIVTADIE